MSAGYVAIDREIFEHPLFQGSGGDARLVAWERLLAKATFRPDGQPRRYRVVHLQRAQICATHRELVKLLNWKIGKVQRFLKMLVRHEMVLLAKSGDSKNESETESKPTYQQTLITICNYDKWQRALSAKWSKTSQTSSQTSGQTLQDDLPFTGQSALQPTEPYNQGFKSLAVEVLRPRPPDGQDDFKNKMRWYHHENPEWVRRAADFEDVRGTALMPRTYLDGRGNWFMTYGERTRPKAKGQTRKRA